MFVSCLTVVMYTVLSLLRFLGLECAISSFSVSILCAKTRFHLRKSQRPSGNVHQSWQCQEGFESCWFHQFTLIFYNSKWHERAVFLNLPEDTCATAIGMLSRLWVLLIHSCALKCFKPWSSLRTVLFTANIQRSRPQNRRHSTKRSVT